MSDSDDDSSNSSDFGKAFTSKDELTASFFSIKPLKINQDSKNDEDDSNDDDNDDDFMNVAENNDVELFSEVVKNLEATQKVYVNNDDPKQHSSKDDGLQVDFSFE